MHVYRIYQPKASEFIRLLRVPWNRWGHVTFKAIREKKRFGYWYSFEWYRPLNSPWPRDTYIRRRIGLFLVQIIACRRLPT